MRWDENLGKSQRDLDDLKDKDIDDSTDDLTLDIDDKYIECASIGQALGALSKHQDSLSIIDSDSFNEKIINYIKLLFDLNNLTMKHEEHELNNNATKLTRAKTNIDNFSNESQTGIKFEQYIGAYIICLANLSHTNHINKHYVAQLNIFELLLGFWFHINRNFNNFNHSSHSNLNFESDPSHNLHNESSAILFEASINDYTHDNTEMHFLILKLRIKMIQW